jgi:hypothetical protein
MRGEEDPEFDDDNASYRSYLSKDDDSTLSGDHDLPDFHQDNEPRGYHKDEGVDGVNDEDQGVGANPGMDKEEEPQEMEEDPLLEELNVVEDDDDAIEDTDRNGEISDVNEESSVTVEEAPKKRLGWTASTGIGKEKQVTVCPS